MPSRPCCPVKLVIDTNFNALAEVRVELPSERPPEELPQVIAVMVKDVVDAGFTKSAIVRGAPQLEG